MENKGLTRVRVYSRREELINSISHAFGILLGVVVGFFLLRKAFTSQDFIGILSVVIYLVGMLASYISSAYYHYLPDCKRKLFLQKCDHAAIYLHIAGTYSPMALIAMRNEGVWGWGIFVFVWLFAIVGSYVSFHKSEKHSNIETICYVVMGCTIFVAFKPLINALELMDKMPVLWWLLAGGASYIIGSIFFSLTKIKYMHTVFHIFVLLGSICHIISIYLLL
ncbi:PAQR family membrane homeostasis protein TrhA [Dysgonomonas massiliensis]|uniref:PAQR family membrane homeostasis protein TrhA n=1 Tax=Dysgonomonas massiliensis TaxID=2040292 RepID=UPI000C77BCE4|nr:hemolysin III family protein [Dysgonomonas massiliensis]